MMEVYLGCSTQALTSRLALDKEAPSNGQEMRWNRLVVFGKCPRFSDRQLYLLDISSRSRVLEATKEGKV